MKKKRLSAGFGIVLVLVILLVYVSFCRAGNRMPKNREEETYSEERTEQELPTLVEQGYGVCQTLPESVKKLVATNIFDPENTFQYEVENKIYEYESEEELDEIKQDRQNEYEAALRSMEEFGAAEYLSENRNFLVAEGEDEDDSLSCVLKFDQKANVFTDKEKIQTIENCGFTGFSRLLDEVAVRIRESNAENLVDDENYPGWHAYGHWYDLYCQGVRFRLVSRFTGDFDLSLHLNYASCYLPEKYRGFIEEIIADGTYCLNSVGVGGDKEIVTFSRNNTIYDVDGIYYNISSGEYENKKIGFIFEGGKLVDYFVTSASELRLDDIDRKILDTYTSGLGKELTMKGEMGRSARIYRAE